MTIYLDLIFIENVLMNYIILFATTIIVKNKTKHQGLKLLLSSSIGSVYAIIVYLDILSIYSTLLAKVILSVVMVYIAFSPNNIKQLLKQILIFYLTSFIFGGCTFALIYFLKPENVRINNGVFVGIYPIKVTLIAGAIAFIITQIAFKLNKSRLSTKNQYLDIEIFYKDKSVRVMALLDSGNLVKDPISNLPVVILEKDIFRKLVSEEFLNYIEGILGGDVQDYKDLQEDQSKIRMVPFMSIGKENGMLTGIRIDKIKIITEDGEIEKRNVIVCIYNKKLTNDNKYNALVGLNLLEGEEDYELTTNIKK